MADNTTLNTGTGGDVIRDIDRSGVKTQVVQLDAGGSSAESLVSSSNPLPTRDPDSNVVLNASSVTSAAVLWTGDCTGYTRLCTQASGTFSATIIIEHSNDNTNWIQSWGFGVAASQSSNAASSLTTGTIQEWPVRTKYMRVRCSSFTSNTSSAITAILRTGPYMPEQVIVSAGGNTLAVSLSSLASAVAVSTAFGSTAFVKAAATTNATSVKASAGNIHGGLLVNNSAAVKYVKFYNKATAPTVGTDTPVAVIGIPASGGSVNLNSPNWAFLRFSTGIAYAITGAVTDADTTAVAANDVSGWIVYA